MTNPSLHTTEPRQLTAAQIQFLRDFRQDEALKVAKTLLHCAVFATNDVPDHAASCIQYALLLIRYHEGVAA